MRDKGSGFRVPGSGFWVLALAAASLAVVSAQSRQPQAQFGVRAELVLVDVSVTDGESRPVSDLQASDFDLEVNGQPRPIANVQYISTIAEPTA